MLHGTGFFDSSELPSATELYSRLYTDIPGCADRVFRRLQSWRQVR